MVFRSLLCRHLWEIVIFCDDFLLLVWVELRNFKVAVFSGILHGFVVRLLSCVLYSSCRAQAGEEK